MVTALWWIPEKQSSIMAGGGFSPTVHNSSVSKIWPSLVISHPRLLSDYLVCHPEGQGSLGKQIKDQQSLPGSLQVCLPGWKMRLFLQAWEEQERCSFPEAVSSAGL